MTWVKISPEEMKRLRRLIADRKLKRAEKRAALGWGKKEAKPKKIALPWDKYKSRDFVNKPRKSRGKTPRQIQIAKNDQLWSKLVRLRDKKLYGPLCRICQKREASVGYHIIPKQRGFVIRWLPANGCAACSGCNLGEMMNRSLYREKHINIFGRDFVEAIEAMALVGVKMSLSDLQDIGAWLRATIEAGQGQPPPGPPFLPV